MLVEAGYSKWKKTVLLCRPWSCIMVMLSRSDTVATEAQLALFTLAYGLRMLIYGTGYWSDAEYMYAAGIGFPPWLWPWCLMFVGTLQSASLFSRYPLTKCSRILRLVASILSTAVWFNTAVIHHILSGDKPEWMFYALLSLGGIWIIIRTRGIKNGR